ncbi:trimeric intracellular cation channel family protein [Arcobacter sp. FWKO B]|uniref:trimeric intracellular cation channel family protein n=1 Tax=Arcobacter sp. FWKO B TaxID=2593672 RepID=UPI0018A351BE|nr:trimeric intracellular cation channel family protein [Arcobacter sp. FWKO B]QOG12702.1 trimeric intracellular cation channel family protein [Arcobacter sp. FWKO B]
MNLLILSDIIGIASFAISGLLIAYHKKLDLLGILILSALTALGGGIIRDLLADRTPFAFINYYPSLTVMGAIILGIIFKIHLQEEHKISNKFLFIIFDSIGLCAFSITGSLVGLDAGFNLFGVIILGFVTALGGGIIRDILLNQIPFILKKEFYGTIAILIALAIFILETLSLLNSITILIVFVSALTLRLLAYKRRWELPKL